MLNAIKWSRQLSWYVLVVMTVISFPWSERLNSVGIVFLFLHFLLDKNLVQKFKTLWSSFGVITKRGNHREKLQIITTALIICFFVLHIIWLCFSKHSQAAWQSIEVKLGFLILPFIFLAENHLTAQRKKTLLLLFSISCCLSFCYAFLYSYLKYHDYGWISVMSRMNISEGVMHPGYYSNFFALAIVWCSLELKSTFGLKKFNYYLPILLLFSLMAIIFLVSKTAILFLALFALYLIWQATTGIINAHIRIATFIIMCICLVCVGTSIPSFQERIKETSENIEHMDTTIALSNSTGSRIIAYKQEWFLIKQHWLKGYGTGEANFQLVSRLKALGYKQLVFYSMHTHHQFFHTWLDLGLIGVIVLLFILGSSFYYFYQQKNRIGFWLILLMLCNLLTDDMLEIQAGSVFFIFFLALFLLQRQQISKRFV